ncbi:MAG: signal peptide peptidase SppA [Rhodospirillales bacterium]|nr:signal peptide peptidase SppA [Rhodospirillales bacterium]
MALDADYLVDRRRLKRRLFLWRSLAIVALVAGIAAGIGRFAGFPHTDYIARLNVAGVIVDDAKLRRALGRIARDGNARAMIVHINSPGGTVVGGEALYHEIRKVAERKPVIAVMGELATSAGYMVALAGNRIIARNGTITGSIGVIMQTTEVSGLLNKLGISTEAVKSGPLKAAPSPFEPMTPAVRRVAQSLVDDMFKMFVDMVAKRRDMSPGDALALADGRVYTGRLAVEKKLIDGIGGEGEAVDWLEKQSNLPPGLPLRDVHIDRNVTEWIDYFGLMGRKAVFSERLTLDGLISVWHPDLR